MFENEVLKWGFVGTIVLRCCQMFHNFVRLWRTKDIKDMDNPKFIIISQENLDFPIIDMILSKGVKIIINCVDRIYMTSCLENIHKNNIKLYFVHKKLFEHFDDIVELFMKSDGFIYKNRTVKFFEPERVWEEALIDEFIDNTLEFLTRERSLLDKVKITGKIITPLEDVLIISRGFYSREDIIRAKRLIRRYNPTIIGVDGGCDIAFKFGITPNIVIGDMDSISLKTISRCEYFVVHSYLDGNCPGKERVPEGKNIGFIKCFGTSEDAALLYAIIQGSKRIYTLGYHNISYDFIEKGRRGMSSSLLIRLKYGNLIKNISEAHIERDNRSFLIVEGIILILCLSIYLSSIMGVFK